MMGMERNSDIVTMASYAPLFANVSNKAWNPDLIYFDKSKVYGTPSYYVQRLFSQNKPTHILKSEQSDSQTVTSNFPIGGIGVGTWKTQSEFKDIKVRTNDGKEISIPKDLGKNQKGEGDWSMVDGALRQMSFASPAMRVFGDIKAESYTLSLKARKLGGDEGFLVSVGQNPDGSFLWFNIGGWMNKLHGLELSVKGGRSVMGRQVPGTIETGRWYDIEIDYTPKTVTCRIDGKTIFNEKTPSNPTFFSNAGIDAETNEIVVKCVSAAANPRPVSIKLDNLRLTTNATGVSLGNPDLMAENSMSKPQNVAPKRINSKVTNGVLTFTPRPYSLTIWRIPSKGNR
jgi:alpha-L-arabinofuranosidase